MRDCPCVFPSESEEEMVTVSGATPGTALRVYLQSGQGGYVRLQQLAHDAKLGWYVQKSMVLERDVVEALVPQLRKGLCLMPKGRVELAGPIKFPRVADGETDGPVTRAG